MQIWLAIFSVVYNRLGAAGPMKQTTLKKRKVAMISRVGAGDAYLEGIFFMETNCISEGI